MRNVLLSLLLVAPVLAGCMDDGDTLDGASASLDGNGTKNLDLGNATGGLDNLTGTGNASDEHLPHVHDYWGARERVLLADETVDLEPWITFAWVFGFRDPSLGGAWWELPQGKTIYQGTGKIEVTLDWQDATITSLALAYRSAAGPEWSEFLPVEKGAPLVIDVKPEMTDLPHSGGSRWTFLLKAAQSPGAAVGAVKLKAEILRVGDLHAFPAHKNYFEDAESLVLMDEETESKSRSWSSQITAFAQGGNGMDEGFTLPEGAIVPPGTEALVIDIAVKDVPARDVALTFRDAGGNYDRAEPIESPEPGVFRFALPVEGSGVDSYYAKTSAWRFFVYVYGGGTAGTPINCGGCTDTTTKIHAKIEAFDESPFGDEEEDPERIDDVAGAVLR